MTRSYQDSSEEAGVTDVVVVSPSMQQQHYPQATPEMCFHCFDVLVDVLEHRGKRVWTQSDLSNVPPFAKDWKDLFVTCPIFVTWEQQRNKKKQSSYYRPAPRGGSSSSPLVSSSQQQQGITTNQTTRSSNTDPDEASSWQLRGCIGTLSPKQLVTAVGAYAQTSALNDGRFAPITSSEIASLRVGVSVLVKYEPCQHPYDWQVGVHGIILKLRLGDGQPVLSATFLPEVAPQQNWNVSQTVEQLLQKAGYRGRLSREIFDRIDCTRYQSSKCKVTFDEYIQYRINLQQQQQEQQNKAASPFSTTTTTTTTSDPWLEAINGQIASNPPSWCRSM
jgi:AMME syndrome candidate gene 1 protein